MVAAVLTTAVVFTTCKQFLDDPEEFFSYWAAEVVSGDYIIDKPTQTNADGVQCIPSTSDVRLTVKLNNPKNFTLVMPTSPANAGKVINFPGLSPQPEYGTDYTLQQAGSTLNLVYKSAFLKEHEWNTGNIGPEITLIADDGREFSKPFTAHVEVNTPPKLSFTGSIGKTANPIGGKHYYVIILKAEDMSETAGIGSSTGKLHKDIKRLTVEGGNSENISFTAGHTAFTVDTSTPVTSRRLLAAGEVTNLTASDLGGSTLLPSWAPSHNADPWALRYRTGTEVKGAQALYKFRLYDKKGLSSEEVSASTVKIKAEDVKLYKNPSDPSTEITTLAASSANPYEITVAPGTQNVTVTAKTATAGAKIAGRVEKHNGSGWVLHGSPFTADTNSHNIELGADAHPGGTIQYRIFVQAVGEGFDNSTEKTFYVTVKTNDTTTINSGIGAWDALKNAVENTGYTTIKINGTIVAPNQAGKQINVRRNVTIQGTNTTNDKLQGTPNTYIFDISGDGNLTLKKLTLLGGKNKNTSTGGGAIYCAGATLTTDDVIIQSCEAKNGGAIYAKEVFVPGNDRPSVITLKNTQIKLCAAAERGGAIYCAKSRLTLDHTIIGGSAAGNTAKKGGGIYFAGGSEECTIPSGCTIQHNKTTIESGRTSGGGGVYVQSGTLTLGGTISDNSALVGGDALASGGGVFVGAKGTFIMKSGATISGNKAKWGGGVYIYAEQDAGAGSFTMEGGTISGCHAGGSGYSSAKGGGVCIKAEGNKKGSFTMQGGEITDCTAEANAANKATGGGVYVEGRAVFNMSGGAVITPSTPNTATNSFNDVYLDHEGSDLASITVTDDLTAAPTAAILTMMDLGTTPGVDSGYYPGRVVVKGSSIDTEGGYKLKPTDAAKFQVTPQTRPPQNWKVVHDGNTSGALRLDP